MFALYLSLALLGLSAVDPVGIALVPLLLVQKHPYRRVLIFLSGSFVSLTAMGLVFAKGLGRIVLRFDQTHTWFVPAMELAGGVILVVVATILLMNYKSGKTASEPSARTQTWLKLGGLQLFVVGALLVAIQSVIDVVFVIAMVRLGQYKLSGIAQLSAVVTYAFTALLIQIIIVVAFRLAPPKQKAQVLSKVHSLLAQYADTALIVVSFILGFVLLMLAIIG